MVNRASCRDRTLQAVDRAKGMPRSVALEIEEALVAEGDRHVAPQEAERIHGAEVIQIGPI
jgi:hypothetical protein